MTEGGEQACGWGENELRFRYAKSEVLWVTWWCCPVGSRICRWINLLETGLGVRRMDGCRLKAQSRGDPRSPVGRRGFPG